MKKILSLITLSLFAAPFAWAEEISLPEALKIAEEKNPRLQAAHREWKAAEAGIGPSRTWPDPELMLKQGREAGEASMTMIGVSQGIPFPGKLTLEGQAAYHAAVAAKNRYEAQRLELAAQIRKAYAGLFYIDREIQVLGETKAVVEQISEAASARVASGKSSTEEALLAQQDVVRLDQDIFSRKQERKSHEFELAALLKVSSGSVFVSQSDIEAGEVSLSLEEALRISQDHPMFAEMSHHVDHLGHKVSRSRMNFLPDFKVSLENETMKGMRSGQIIGVGISYPLWLSKPRGELKQAEFEQEKARAEQEGVFEEIRQRVKTAYTEVHTRALLAKSYRTSLLPLTAQAVKVSLAGYETGKGDFLKLLETVRRDLQARLEYYEQLSLYESARADFESSIGKAIQ